MTVFIDQNKFATCRRTRPFTALIYWTDNATALHLLPVLAGDAEGHGAQQKEPGGGAAENLRGETAEKTVCPSYHTEHAVLFQMLKPASWMSLRIVYKCKINLYRLLNDVTSRWNIVLSITESMLDRGGKHPFEESPAGSRGWGSAAADQRWTGLWGGHPAAGGRDQGPEEPAGQQEASTRSGGHQGESQSK